MLLLALTPLVESGSSISPVVQVAFCSACPGGNLAGLLFPRVNLLLELLVRPPTLARYVFLVVPTSRTPQQKLPSLCHFCCLLPILFTHSSELENVSCLVSLKALWGF